MTDSSNAALYILKGRLIGSEMTGGAMHHPRITLRNLGRAKGDSVIEAAAHLAGIDLFDPSAERWHRGSERGGILSCRMLAPPDAPSSALDIQVFWIASEQNEQRANARLGRIITVSFPPDLCTVRLSDLATLIGEALVARYSVVVLAAVHRLPGGEVEAHFLLSAREVRKSGFEARACAMFDAGSGSGAKEMAALTDLIHSIIAGFGQGGSGAALPAQTRAPAAERPGFRVPVRPLTPLEAAQIQMDLAIARADARGVLMPTPPGHSHAAAFAERTLARRANPPPPPPIAPLVRDSGPPASWMARHLGRLARKARAGQDSWARLLGSEAELLSRWRTSILTSGNKAREAAMISPTTQLEPEFLRALNALDVDRVAVYGTQPFFFLDIEALASTITDFAAALRAPHDDVERVMRTRARLAEALCPAERASSAAIHAARQAFDYARTQTTDAAKLRGVVHLRDARREMREAREHVERLYHITQPVLIEPDPFAGFDEVLGGGARNSDSHQRQLRPRTNLQPGR